MADMNTFNFVNPDITDIAERFISIAENFKNGSNITSEQMKALEDSIELMHKETKRIDSESKKLKTAVKSAVETRKNLFDTFLAQLGDETKGIREAISSVEVYEEFENKVKELRANETNVHGRPYADRNYSALQGTMAKFVKATIQSAVDEVKGVINEIVDPDALEKIAMGELQDAEGQVSADTRQIIKSRGIKFKSARTKAKRIQRATGRISTGYQLQAVKEYMAAGNDAQKMQKALRYDERTNRQIQQSAEQMKRAGIKTADQVEQSCKAVEQRMTAATKAYENMDVAEHKLSRAMEAGSAVSYLRSKKGGKEFVEGSYKNTIVAQIYAGNKEQIKQAQEAMQSSQTLEGLLTQLQNKIRTKSKGTQQLRVVYDETKQGLQLLSMTNAEVSAYEAAEKSGGGAGNAYLRKFMRESGRSVFVSTGGGAGSTIGMDRVRGGMSFANTPAIYIDSSGKAVSGTRIEADIVGLINVLETGVKTVQDAFAITKKTIAEESTTAFRGESTAHRSAGQATITAQNALSKVAYVVAKQYGMSEENSFKMLSDVVLKLSQFHSDKTGTYDWDAVAKEVTDFQDVIPRLMGTTKLTLEGIATQLRRWSLDIAGSAANATETGVYGLAPAAWMSPGGDISAEHSRHPQQATKYGEYTEETIKARKARNQAAIVNEKTAALYGNNIGKAVSELTESGDLMVSNVLNIHEEYLRELFLKYRETLKEDLVKATNEDEKKKIEAELQKTLGGISGDAMLMRESLMAETSGLHKGRKQEVSASRYKELYAKYSGDTRKMLGELRPDIDIGKITELKTEKNESGSITFVFTERQDLMESRKVGGAYTADRNLASAVSDRFLTFLQNILGVDSIDAIKLGEEAGLNNRGGRLLAIIQHIYDQLYDKSKKELTTEGKEFVKRITTDSDSPFKNFLTFSNGLFSTHTQTDANGNQRYINAQEAFRYLLANYGDKFAGGAIKSGSDFGQSKEDFYMMSEALNMLYDFEYNNPGGYGVREYAAIGRKLKAYQRESGKDLSQTIAYYQEEQEDIDKKAAALKERINKNIADASVANYTKKSGDIVIGSGDDADIKISSIDADQLAKLEYAAGDITAESYAGSIYQKIDEAVAAREKQIADDLRSSGKTEDEIAAAVKEFRESARIIVRGQENMPLAAGVQDLKGRVYGGGQLAFTYMSPRANLDFGSGAPESYQVAETLEGMVSLLRGIINVNDLIKDGVDATEEVAKLTDLGTGILKRQIDSVTDKDSALQKQIYKHELKNSGWFAIANIDDEAISGDDDVNKHLKDVVNRGVGASREKIRKLIGNDIGFLRNQYAYMYGKEADKAWSTEQLQNEILDAADPRNAKYKAGKYIRANINRYPDFDNMMDVRHGIVYVDSTLTGDSVGNVTNAFAAGMQGDFDKDHIFVNVMQGKRLAQMSIDEYDRWMKEQEEIERRDQAWVQFNKDFLAANQTVDNNGKIQYDSYFGADKETHDRIKEVVAVAQRNNRSKAGLWSSAHSKFTNALQDSGIDDSDLGFALSRMGEFVFGMTEQNVVGYKHLIDAALKKFNVTEEKDLTKEQITQTYNELLAQGDKMLTDLNSLENNYDLSSHFEAMVNNGLIKSSNGVLKGGNPTEARYIWSMFEGVRDKKAVFEQLQEIAQKAGTSLSYEMFGLKEENGELVRADATADFAKLPIEFVKAMMKQLQSTFYDRTGMQLVSGNFGSGAQVGAMARRKYANADNQKANTDAQYAEYLKSLGIRPINTEKLEGSLNGNTTALNDIGKYLQQIISILSGGGGVGGYGGAGDVSKFGTGHSYGYTAHDIADLVFPPNISSYGKKIDADDLTERVLKTAGFSDKNIPNFYYLSKGQGNEKEYSELTNKYIDSLNAIGERTNKAAMKAFGFTSKKDFDKAADSAISRMFGSYVHSIADQRALNERGVTDTKKEDDVRRYNAELRAQMRYLGFSQEEIESKVSSAAQYVEEIFKTVEKNFGKIRASELRLSDSASGRSNLTHGILDALAVDENGNITILDWKTGHDRITDNEKTQVRVYQALAEQLRGEMEMRYGKDEWAYRNASVFDENGNIKQEFEAGYKQKEDEIIDAVYSEFVKKGGSRFGSKEDITQFMRILYENQGGRGGFTDQDIKSGIVLINSKGQVVTWSGGKVDESGLARLIRTPSDVTEADRAQFTSGVETLPGGSVSSASKKSAIIAAIHKRLKLQKELAELEITQNGADVEAIKIKKQQIAEEKKKIKIKWKKGEEGAPDEVDRKAIRNEYKNAKIELANARKELAASREENLVSEAKKAVNQLYKDRKSLAEQKALLSAATKESDKKLISANIADIEKRIQDSASKVKSFFGEHKSGDSREAIQSLIRDEKTKEAANRIKAKTAEDVKAETDRVKAKNEYISQLKEELKLKKEIFDLENKQKDTTEDDDLFEKYGESIVAKNAQLKALQDKMRAYTVEAGSDEERERASASAAYEQYETEQINKIATQQKSEEESRRDESYKRAVALLGDRTRLTTEIAQLQHLKEAIERRGGEDMQDNLDETNTQIAEFTELLKGVNDALSGILEGTGGASREAWTKEQQDAFKVKESVAASRAQRGVHKEQLQADIEYTKEYTDLLAKERELSVKVGGYQRDAATSAGKLKQNLIIVQESYNKELEETRAKISKINEEEAAAAKEGKSRIKDKETIDAQNELARDQAMKSLYAKKPYSNIFEYIKADISRATQRIVDFGLAAKVLNTARKEIQQVYQNILKLDEAMTNLRIVTGSNTEQAKSMMNTYNDLAMQLGTTTQAVAQSAAEWLRQGYSVSETNELIKSSTYLSRLGFMDMNQSVTALTSVMKGFRIEATDSMDIVDKLTQLDAKYATTAGDIATALSRTSAVAREAGLDLDQTAAALTTMIDVSQQNASSVGNAFRTILARYGNVKAGAFTSLVGDSDDIDDTNGSINDTEKVLGAIGIKIRSSSSDMRDFDDVMDELADKWVTLTDVEKNLKQSSIMEQSIIANPLNCWNALRAV